jgi:glutamate---cysteine ligase / carboxylate-amine ligase
VTVTPFHASDKLTLGVELELQLVDLSDFDLAAGALDLLTLLEKQSVPANVSPELTESMIEIGCGVFEHWWQLRDCLQQVRDHLVEAADWLNLGICGGGTHPFQRWQKRKIFSNERFLKVSELYGYLAKQFTVFGQHIHIGCEDGDSALKLLHALNAYVPHFIALSSASPFYQGADTQFCSSRLNSVAAFPLSGRAPFYLEWDRFCKEYFEPMQRTGIVRSMKDFYWDLRPKPEYGTIELRVCDTPLTVERASLLVAYMQWVCRWLQDTCTEPLESEYLVYSYNRFQACRFGMEGNYIDPITKQSSTIRESLEKTFGELVRCYGSQSQEVESELSELAVGLLGEGDSARLKSTYRTHGTLEDVVQFSLQQFRS